MRKTPIVLLSLLILLSMFVLPSMATITQSNNDPSEGATGVSVTKDFSVLINATNGTINGNMTLYKAGVLTSTTQTITEQANGTQTFLLPQLDGNTLYTVYVHVNDTDTGSSVNQSYNFTTGSTPLTLDTTNFGSGEIALLGLIIIIIIIAFIASLAYDLKNNKKLTAESVVSRLIIVIFFCVLIAILGALV